MKLTNISNCETENVSSASLVNIHIYAAIVVIVTVVIVCK